jgi:hypothetical protein
MAGALIKPAGINKNSVKTIRRLIWSFWSFLSVMLLDLGVFSVGVSFIHLNFVPKMIYVPVILRNS